MKNRLLGGVSLFDARGSRAVWTYSALVIALVIAASGWGPSFAQSSASGANGQNIYVSPSGSDSASGGAAAPLRTVQAALNRAVPGSIIRLGPGTYNAGGTTQRDGLATNPITIIGPAIGTDPTLGVAAQTATVFGTGHVLDIANSYYTVEGFTINGQPALTQKVPLSSWPRGSAADAQAFKVAMAATTVNSRPVYIDGGSGASGNQPVVGTRIWRMTILGGGGECVRVRDNTTKTAVSHTKIQWCGLYGVQNKGVYEFHNGEGVYIGTSPKSTTLVGFADDQTSGTVVDHDLIKTFGSECFDVKENAFGNVLSHSTCEHNTEPATNYGSNVELRGYSNTIFDNVIRIGAGFGIKIDSDTPSEDRGLNVIRDNQLSGFAGQPLYDNSTAPAGKMCGNTATPSSHVAWQSPCPQ